jgi:hypothetical protein
VIAAEYSLPLSMMLVTMGIVRDLEPVKQVDRDALGTIKCGLLRESAKGRSFHN